MFMFSRRSVLVFIEAMLAFLSGRIDGHGVTSKRKWELGCRYSLALDKGADVSSSVWLLNEHIDDWAVSLAAQSKGSNAASLDGVEALVASLAIGPSDAIRFIFQIDLVGTDK
jgi:hypothetical protein